MAEEAQVYAINRYRNPATSLRTRFVRIITRAGLSTWPKLWQNLRSNRQTELLEMGYALQCVTTWISNSPKVVMDNYIQVRDEDFQLACQKAVQNPVQIVTANDC